MGCEESELSGKNGPISWVGTALPPKLLASRFCRPTLGGATNLRRGQGPLCSGSAIFSALLWSHVLEKPDSYWPWSQGI